MQSPQTPPTKSPSPTPPDAPSTGRPPRRKDIEVAEKQRQQEEQALLVKMRQKLKASAYTAGGHRWHKLFTEQDKDRSGQISWPEFKSMCRKVLKLTDDEKHIKSVFSYLDNDKSGEISIEELVEWMEKDGGAQAAGPAAVRPAEVDTGELRIDIEYHAHGENFHTSFPTERYEKAAQALKEELSKELKSCGSPFEIRLNPGPPHGYREYFGQPGWWVHAKTADFRLRSKFAMEAPHLLQYPRLGAYEITVRLPAPVKRAEGAFKGLPRTFQAWSKLKRKKWPKEGFGEWLGKQLKLARTGDASAVEALNRAGKTANEEADQGLPIDDPDRFRRIERNAPMFFADMTRVEMPPAPVVKPGPRKRTELPAIPPPAKRLPPGLMEHLRSRLKGAAYSAGGRDWATLFRRQDKDNSGNIGWEEFKTMCRRTLRLTEQDPILRALFLSLDGDKSGELEIDELVAYVQDPIRRMRHRLMQAAKASDGRDGKPWTDHILSADEDGSGQIDFDEFRVMCKRTLRLEESREQMKQLFDSLDADGSGEISVDELIDFVENCADEEEAEAVKPEPSPGRRRRSSSPREKTPSPGAEKPTTPRKRPLAAVSRVRARLKGAAYALGGKDWQKLFSDQDSDGSGQMEWSHFEAFCRETLKLADAESSLKEVFDAVDSEGVGSVAIKELVGFVSEAAVSVEACMEVLGKAEWASQLHYEQQCP